MPPCNLTRSQVHHMPLVPWRRAPRGCRRPLSGGDEVRRDTARRRRLPRGAALPHPLLAQHRLAQVHREGHAGVAGGGHRTVQQAGACTCCVRVGESCGAHRLGPVWVGSRGGGGHDLRICNPCARWRGSSPGLLPIRPCIWLALRRQRRGWRSSAQPGRQRRLQPRRRRRARPPRRPLDRNPSRQLMVQRCLGVSRSGRL